jgi:putative OPT family oligopeptide transporter
MKGQLTLRALVIGVVGCIVITATSVYIALKMGALPWPIIFAAVISLFFLKALARIGGRPTSLNEANVTHTVMSAGAMVAGGLAFTIPGIWILDGASEVDWWQLLIVALAGCVFGLICCAVLRRHFIERTDLEYPIGTAAAQTLVAGDSGGKAGAKLFGAMGLAGVYTFLRDGLGAIPSMFLGKLGIPGVSFGIYNSPMMLAVGFMVGTAAVVVWFVGALLGNFGIIVGGSAAGLWSTASGQGICSSLGMGVMMGCGVGVIIKMLWKVVRGRFKGERGAEVGFRAATTPGSAKPGQNHPLKKGESDCANKSGDDVTTRRRWLTGGLAACAIAAVALVVCFALGLGPVASVLIVAFVWVTSAMAAQSAGQTGIDPMEIFGLIVLLIVAATSALPHVQLFFVAAIIAVACGLAGDVMNDFKAGHLLHTNPRAQWIGEAVGSIVGAVVAVAVICILVGAYGASAFGPHGSFIAAQASVVATMVGGIPSLPAFIIGLAGGFLLYLTGLPVMMLGLGIYLPFYMSFTAFLGAMAKVVYDAVCKRVNKRKATAATQSETTPRPAADPLEKGESKTETGSSLEKRESTPATPDAEERVKRQEENGLIVASGLLGGESIVGVILALVAVIGGISV